MKLTPRKVTVKQVVTEVSAFGLLLAGTMLSAVAAASLNLRYLAAKKQLSWGLTPPVGDVLLMFLVATVLIFCSILLLRGKALK